MVNLLRIKLVNFAGLSVATGLNTVEIDRTNSKNNIVLILGNNGSGKSSLLNEITLLPLETVEGRSESRILKDHDGLKEIDLIKNNEWIYKISIQYPATKTTKCYITKQHINSPEVIDLNPNGNVSSYLEVIKNELGVTKCYTNIGYLSAGVSNILEMKPTERNSFISEWISDIDTFLDGYKTVSRKSYQIKKDIDVMNRDIGKMDSIDTENKLKLINSELDELNTRKEKNQTNLVKLQLYLDQLKEKSISTDELYSRKNRFLELSKELNIDKDRLLKDIEFINSINIESSNSNDLINTINLNTNKIEFLTSQVKDYKERIYKLKAYILQATEEIESKYDIDIQYTTAELLNQIEKLSIEKESLSSKNINPEFDIDSNLDISDVLIIDNLFYDIYHKLKDIEFDFNSGLTQNNSLTNRESMLKRIEELDKSKIYLEQKIDLLNSKIHGYLNSALDRNILSLRPESCSIKCGIINELMNYYESERVVPQLEAESGSLQEQRLALISEIDELKSALNKLDAYSTTITRIDKMIYDNISYFKNYPDVVMSIINTDSYNISRNIHKLIDYNNIIKEFASVNSRRRSIDLSITDLKNKYSLILSKTQLSTNITEKSEEIEKLNIQIQDTQKTIENLAETTEKLKNLSIFKQNLDGEIEKYRLQYLSLEEEKKQLKIYNEHSYFIKVINDLIIKLNAEKTDIITNINEKQREKDNLTSIVISRQQIENMRNKSLKTLERYNILSQIWSPKVGYPSWKIKNFTNVLTEETNKDLLEMWGDSLMINEIRIGANEFSIIVDRNGKTIGDAIACSSGERATLALAISFAILKLNLSNIAYNIVRLDELDGPFDVERRSGFIDIVNSRLDDLNCQTCFIVSHNNEFDSVDCDVILLKGWDNIPMNMSNKNVLFKIK